ncbi:electron transfer flavoprotein subunit beta/FixA family protein [Wohlfahrtiimonas populi]|uniref:electron transfer flavoprotein subunit beta/FixA family protein n=1 Tax=Wohlfahrtiimonas populi TaxID=1940240 RepID=UPI00098CF550|nr:electron transfer flavoprotein subunit beta/FixA family protein [Wohlfahrtiimonas populi]
MKVLVAVKQVIDHNVRIRLKGDKSAVETDNVKLSINPFDEIAVEEAVRLKEKGTASEVIAVSIGTKNVEEVLRSALAMGADKAILVNTDMKLDSLGVAKILAKIGEREQPSLYLLGKQSIDRDANQTPQMLAALLNASQGTYINEIAFDNNRAVITREIDGGMETLSLSLPAVVSSDLRLNEPRFIKLPSIMQARRKPLEVIELDSLGCTIRLKTKVEALREPEGRKAGVMVTSVEELVNKLKHEAKVI